MIDSKKHITGFVLAGGKCSRMGQDKGLMLLNGKEMVLNIVEQLLPCVDEVVIVSNNEAYKKFGFTVIEDLIKNAGPAAGIFTALKYSKSDLNFFVSCDMPFISTAAIEYIIQQATDKDICIATANGKQHPLFGIYNKSILNMLELLIHQNELKIKTIIQQFNHQLIDMSRWEIEQENLFCNINTKQDFEMAINKTVCK